MSRVLVLGGAGEMGSVAVADLIAHTDHDVTVGDVRPDVARALLQKLGAPVRAVYVNVDEPASLSAAVRDTDLVLNATLMRHNLLVTDAAIANGVHMVDLGSYYEDTLEQLKRSEAAEQAGVRIVPGCGTAPGLTNVLARLGYDKLDRVDGVRIYSFLTHPMWTSPGIVVTRLDASSAISVTWKDGSPVEHPPFSGQEDVNFPAPYGKQEVHLVPHPEPATLARYLDVPNVVFKVGYPKDEETRIQVLLELNFHREEEITLGNVSISPKAFAAAYIGSRGIAPDERSVTVKHVFVDGERAGEPVTLSYYLTREETGRSASATVTGTVAAIAADLVAESGPAGVHPPETGLAPQAVVDQLARRGIDVSESEEALTA